MADSSSGKYTLLDQLAEEFADRYRRGERPALAEYTDRYPELAEEIRELFPAMAEVEQAEGDIRAQDSSPDSALPDLKQVGDFRILGEVGRGGMGVVYEAEQVSLGRRVALKVLPSAVRVTDRQRRRFEREAKAAARLHHTNIVPVFGVGEHDGTPYYVMQFIQGSGLDEVFEEIRRLHSGTLPYDGTPLPAGSSKREVSAVQVAKSLMSGEFALPGFEPTLDYDADQPQPVVDTATPGSGGNIAALSPSSSSVILAGTTDASGAARRRKLTYWHGVAHIGVQVAGALEHAHKLGVVHRDIKPSNLLLDTAGQVWVTDFGLAKAENEQNLTDTGDILGTLRYMPPEAFEGRADATGDVYALGLTLYEMLALRPAYDEKDRNRLIKQVTTSEPARLDRLNREVPRDLVTIVHKAIERDPAHRYATAADMEADLQSFLEDEPIRARRQTHLERYMRWARRNPGIAVMGAVLTAVLVLATVGSLLVAGRMTTLAQSEARAAEDERAAREEAERNKLAAQESAKHAEEALKTAEAHYARARAAVNDYLTAVSDDERLQGPGLGPLREELLESALSFYDQFLEERKDDPALRRELADVYLKAASIQHDLGQTAASNQSYSLAQRLYEQLLDDTPNDPELRNGLAQALRWTGKFEEAIVHWEEAVRPNNPNYLGDLGTAYILQAFEYRGGADPKDKDPAKELEYLRKALDVSEQLARLRPHDFEARRGLASSLNSIASALNRGNQGPQHARQMLNLRRRAAEELEHAHRIQLTDLHTTQGVVRLNWNVALAAAPLGQIEEAIAAYERALEVADSLARDYPDFHYTETDLVYGYQKYLTLLDEQGRLEEAARIAREGAERIAELRLEEAHYPFDVVRFFLAARKVALARAAASPEARSEVERKEQAVVSALRYYFLAGHRSSTWFDASPEVAPLRERADYHEILDQVRILERAEAVIRKPLTPPAEKVTARRECLDALLTLAAPEPSVPRVQRVLATAHQNLGAAYLQADRVEEAQAAFAEAIAIRQRLVEERPENEQLRLELAQSQINFGNTSATTGRLVTAVQQWEKALAILETQYTATPRSVGVRRALSMNLLNVGREYGKCGLSDEAIKHFTRGYEVESPPSYFYWYDRAVLMLQQGDQQGFQDLLDETLSSAGEFTEDDGVHRARILLAVPVTSERQRSLLRGVSREFKYVGKDWQKFIRAFARVRIGEIAEGVEALEECGYPGRPELAWAALAIGYHQLGEEASAREALGKADSDMNRRMRGVLASEGISLGQWFEDWLLARILYGEAYQAINGGPPSESPFDRLHSGRVLHALGRAEEAEAEFAAALELRPKDAEVLLARGQVFARLGETDRMDADLNQARGLKAKDPHSWISVGRTLAELGEQQKADAAFSEAADLTHGNLNPFLDAGWWVIGPYDVGRTFGLSDMNFAQLRNPDPSKPVSYLKTAHNLNWKHVPAAAETGAIKMESIGKPGSVSQSYYCLAYVHADQDRTATLLLKAGEDSRLWVNGRLLFEGLAAEGDGSDPVHIPVTLTRGRNSILVRAQRVEGSEPFCQCRFDEAAGPAQPVDHYQRLVETHPKRPWLWIELGWHHGKLGRWDDAVRAFAQAAELKPNDPQVWRARGRAYADLGKWDEAAADFAKALELDTVTNPNWSHGSTATHDEIVRREEIFSRVIEDNRDDQQLWMQRVHLLARQARWAKAAEAATRVMELAPDDTFTWQIRATLRLQSGDVEGYRQDCLTMLKQIGDITDGLAAERVAMATLLVPEGAEEPGVIVESLKGNRQNQIDGGWYDVALGLGYHRDGRHEQAPESLRKVSPSQRARAIAADAIRAMVQQSQGDDTAAGRTLRKATEAMATLTEPGPEEMQPDWLDWVQADTLLREAEALIPDQPAVVQEQPAEDSTDETDRELRGRAERAATRVALALISRDIGQEDDAEHELRSILSEQAAIAAEAPRNASYQADLADTHRHLAELLADLGRVQEGLDQLRTAVSILIPLDRGIPAVLRARVDVATGILSVGKAAQDSSPVVDAAEAYRQAIALLANGPNSAQVQTSTAEWLVVARCYARLGQSDDARDTRSKAMGLLKANGTDLSLKPVLRDTVLELGLLSAEARELLAAAAPATPEELDRAVLERPKHKESIRARGDWYANQGLWGKAAADYERLTELEPTTLNAQKLTIAYITLGDTERFHALCQELVDRWGRSENGRDCRRALKACCLLPGVPVDADKLARLASVGESNSEDNSPFFRRWQLIVMGLYYHRVGRYDDAIDAERESRGVTLRENHPSEELLTMLSLLVESMSLAGRGENEEARQAIAEAKEILDHPVPGVDDLGPTWHDWLTGHILLREAKALLEKNEGEPKN